MAKEKFESNAVYADLVKSFRDKREKKGISQHGIDMLVKGGWGRVNNFESMKYSPTLLTFVNWCTEAGIEISLKVGTRKHKMRLKQASQAHQDRKNDPALLIDQVKHQQQRKSKINEH